MKLPSRIGLNLGFSLTITLWGRKFIIHMVWLHFSIIILLHSNNLRDTSFIFYFKMHWSITWQNIPLCQLPLPSLQENKIINVDVYYCERNYLQHKFNILSLKDRAASCHVVAWNIFAQDCNWSVCFSVLAFHAK